MAFSTTISLPDGHDLHVRPLQADDKDLLLRVFEGLSPESRYRRFLCVMETLSPAMQRQLSEVDHHDHEALIALDPQTGEPVAVGRFVRLGPASDQAEFAISVVDAWQQRGVGTAMFALLSDRAREEGIHSFVGDVLAQNVLMHNLMAEFGHTTLRHRDGGVEELEVPLPDAPLGEDLAPLLRSAVSHD